MIGSTAIQKSKTVSDPKVANPPPLRPIQSKPIIETSESKENEPKTTLRQCFSTIVDRKALCVTMSELRSILATDLNINVLNLQVGMENVLAEALAYYMRLWPGWCRSTQYFSGNLQFKKWFEKFRQYLIYKINYIIKKGQTEFETTEDNKVTSGEENKRDIEIQTDTLSTEKKTIYNKVDAPYQLCIGGPPSILNSLVFVKQGNDVLIKQHSERPWTNLSMKQLLNWPYVGIEMKFPDIYISRNNILEHKRYIGLSGDIKQTPPIDTETTVTVDNVTNQVSVYSFNFLSTYIKQLMATIEACPSVTRERSELLDSIFSQYLKDIQEANVHNNTVCTNTMVTYHIGKSIYFRNKRIMASGGNPNEVVNFYEFFAPKVKYGMGFFKAVQDLSSHAISFKSLNKLNPLLKEKKNKEFEEFSFMINNTCLLFKCTLCNESFSGPYAKQTLIIHFKKDHKLEQSVLCFKCRRQHDILILTENRWKHDCVQAS